MDDFVKSRALDNLQEIINKRAVELVAFCIMPNHFHLIIKELEEGRLAVYMQRVLTAYSKYYNTKYSRSGHVFQGPYQVVHIEDDRQLLHLSAYIHRNPREILRWLRRENEYFWSSYQDFVNKNRWSGLLVPDIILGQFRNNNEYEEFLKTSPAKAQKEELEYLNNL
ncbi:MAG TPA: transposase [Candidatus Paceibacterota bacterium]